MVVIDTFTINQCLSPSFDGIDYLPAEDTRGGILLARNTSAMSISSISHDTCAITGEVQSRDSGPWWITVVYGPQSVVEKRLS
jgi:hypothetical protein